MRRNKPADKAPFTPKMKVNPMAVAFAGVKPSSSQLATPDFSLQQTFSLPAVPKGVIPESSKVAMDSAFTPYQEYGYDSMFAEGLGFLGYSYLAQLSQRAEYRKPAEIVAEYMTKNWLEFKGVGDDDKTEKIKQLEDEFKRLHVKDAFAKAAELDCYYGRSQIFIDTGNQETAELTMKLPASPVKIKKNGIKKLKVIEPYWTYPNDYNSTNPLADDFFRPNSWFVMGQQIHTTRFLNFVARPVSDILKPVYNFGGLSLTQLLKPYVDNWLRTRQSVSDLLYSFSINVLKTNMESILSGGGGEDVGLRVDVFNKYRDNRGCFVLDKDTEDFINVSAPLGTIDKLQAQSQEQMASVAGIPLIILLKITPSGLNASSDGEIRTFNDWIESQQVSLFGPQMDRLLPMIQLSLWGEIDKDITYKWITLNPKDEIADANRRKVEADTDAVYIQEGVIDTTEARTRLAKQEDSPYAGLDLSIVPDPPQESEEDNNGILEEANPAMDKEFVESEHPRQDDGKFRSGSGEGSKETKKENVGPSQEFLASVKKSKAKLVKTKFNGGATLEFPKGVSESTYQPIIDQTDELLNSLKGTPKATNAGYIKRAFEHAAEDKKYTVSSQLDNSGNIVGAASMYPISDSMRIEAIGGIGKGGGIGCMLSAIRASKKAGKGGAVTLTPVRDSATVAWYENLGFDLKPNSRYGEFWLSPEAAANLEKRFK